MKVLVVDDEPAIRLLCRFNLEADGHTVVEASTRDEALAAAAEHRPDAILLDLMMPGIDPSDEWAVGRALRDMPETAQTPIVFLSARADLNGGEAAVGGTVRYVTKPFDPTRLGALLRELVGS